MHTAVIVGSVCVIFTLSWLLIAKGKLTAERALLIAAALFGFLFNLVQTPGMVADEPAHIETAYRYANVLLGKPYATENGGLWERKEDAPLSRFSQFHEPTAEAYAQVSAEWRFFCSPGGGELVEAEGRDVRTGFAAYLPTALGVALGRALHLGTYPMLYLGRLMNLLCYVLCVAWAVRLTPVKKFLFALLGVTPMALQLACSFSYDVPVIGMSFLFTAYALRMIYQDEKIGWKQWLFCCGLSFLLTPCKFGYCTLFVMLFFVQPQKLGGRGKKALLISAVMGCGLLGLIPQNWSWFVQYLSGAKTMASDTHNALGVELYTLGWVTSHVGESVQILLNSIRRYFTFYWQNMLCGRLSVFEPVVDWSLFVLIDFSLGAMTTQADVIRIRFRHRLGFLGVFAVTALGSLVLMLFMYTPFGSDVVEGVQGRYFLPVLPMLFMFLGSRQIFVYEKATRRLAAIAVALNGAVLTEILMWTLERA